MYIEASVQYQHSNTGTLENGVQDTLDILRFSIPYVIRYYSGDVHSDFVSLSCCSQRLAPEWMHMGKLRR